MCSAVKTRLYLAQRQPANTDLNLAADDRRAERFNHTGVIVSNIENIIRLFFVFWKLHSKSTWLKNGHDASVWKHIHPYMKSKKKKKTVKK